MTHVHPHDPLADTLPFVMPDTSSRRLSPHDDHPER
jgi:hypothetical protein